jgi:predicted SAM-dependent methyltransferase
MKQDVDSGKQRTEHWIIIDNADKAPVDVVSFLQEHEIPFELVSVLDLDSE